MLISRKKYEQELERAYNKARDEEYERQQKERMWSSHLNLKERVDKLEQRFDCHVNGQPEPKEAPTVALQANPF